MGKKHHKALRRVVYKLNLHKCYMPPKHAANTTVIDVPLENVRYVFCVNGFGFDVNNIISVLMFSFE